MKKSVTILLWNDHFEVISTHFFSFVGSCNQPYVELGLNIRKILATIRVRVWVLVICVAFSTCSVVVVGSGGGGETIGVNGVPTLLADSTWTGTIWLLNEGNKNPVIFLLLFVTDLSILLV